MFSSFSEFNRRRIIIIASVVAVALLFVPFPTELIPEWKVRVVDEQNRPLRKVNVEQSWTNYTFGDSGFDNKDTDENGFVVFPPRLVWTGAFSRIVYPPLAALMLLAHGSAGTDAYVRVFDKNYFSDYFFWREEETIYRHKSGKLPDLIVVQAGK
jgi:hypothetical protein